MLKIKQVIVVEGRYDKAKLSSLVDAEILTTGGFDIFRDKEKLGLLRRLAEKHGLIILTDSDAAGFRIRAHIAGAVDPDKITHVYIPDLFGKESRKRRPGAEGKLGVEGIPAETLLAAFRRAGVAVEASENPGSGRKITTADFAAWGLSGGDGSAERRRELLGKLGLPSRMSSKAMLGVVNSLYTYEEFAALLEAK
ncbi:MULTISPECIES: toprim domain-containing protein [Anaerotruncus]|jgi:ribonuclease M5|uniref:toprim domain-containing protein n=1 Tax=Anaerotruncus TaxID=244127 RepID=UPI000832AB63|nr:MULTISPECIES: DUF4093 domain-containing protein [Anaerotruncus]RGX54438.1 DUF4093 domain-containing protein [Anaerotruncus sp. AF02-27]